MVIANAFRRLRPEWTLLEATSAEEALTAVAAGAGRLAPVDFNMPGTDGLNWSPIFEDPPGMPIALVSANAQNEIIQRAGPERWLYHQASDF
jgi:CheY-like chemotaxis protein